MEEEEDPRGSVELGGHVSEKRERGTAAVMTNKEKEGRRLSEASRSR